MIHVISHANCPDGFTAAWVLWQKFKMENELGLVQFHFESYGHDLPMDIAGGDQVFIVDFSYPRHVLEELATKTALAVIDHHKTALENLTGLPFAVFDMNKSGAMLAWNYFFPDQAPPLLVNYIEDRDLWRWSLPYSKEVSAANDVVNKDFESWTDFNSRLEHDFDDVVADGFLVIRYRNKLIETLMKNVLWAKIDDYLVPVVNCSSPELVSYVGNALLTEFPNSPFTAYFYVTKDGREYWGLRAKGEIDVSTIAKRYGGGGHPNASGFVVDSGDIQIYAFNTEIVV